MDEDLDYKILVNHLGQYSLWPETKPAPTGWTEVGPSGAKADLLEWVNETWKAGSSRLLVLLFVLFACLPGARATSVDVSVKPGERTKIGLQLPGEFAYQALRMSNPDRIVVDLQSASLFGELGPSRTLPAAAPFVRQIRIGVQRPGNVRVVVDLQPEAARANFTVARLAGSNGLQIEVNPEAGGKRLTAKATSRPSPTEVDRSLAATAPRPAVAANSRTETAANPAKEAVEHPIAPTSPAPERILALPAAASFELPARIGIANEVNLTLRDALHMALVNNQELAAYRVDQEAAEHRLRSATGAYVPTFSAVSSFEKQVLPVSNSLAGSNTGSLTNRTWQTQPTLSGAAPRFGGSYEVSFLSQRFSTNNQFATLNPNYPSALTFRYTQPLMRGLHFDAARHAIAVARQSKQLTRETFKRRILEVVQAAEQAYWELSFARKDLEVQLEALAIAKTQEQSNRRRLDRGDLAPIEVVAAQTQLSTFEISVYSAQEALARAENALKSVILGDREAPLWTAALNPITPPEELPSSLRLAEIVQEAMAKRPDRLELEAASSINAAGQRLSREQLKPQVDLVASYSRVGLAGQEVISTATNPLTDSLTAAIVRLNQLSAVAGLSPVAIGAAAAPPSLLVGGYGQSLNGLWGGDFPTAMVQLRISLPLSDRTAKANLGLAVAESRQIEHRRRSLDQSIEAEVRNAIQAIESANHRLNAARQKRKSAEEQYHSEDRRFRQGASSYFLVQQRQLTMVAAMSQVHRAEADLSQAVSQLEYARGTNYLRHNIKVE